MKTETAARQALIARLRARLRDGQRAISERFLADHDAASLLRARCRLVDGVLGELWCELAIPESLSLVGVGGYGRGELFPASDIDVLILLPGRPENVLVARLEQLVCMFWDIGLDTGHSVRTIEQCLDEASADTTVQTALLEARLLAGDPLLFAGFQSIFHGTLDSRAFYQTKRMEQADRHQRFSDTACSLEANCKDGPGGLRDLQLILWVARAAGYGHSWQDLEARGFITSEEGLLLQSSEGFLRRLRTHLHLLVGRREDRLLFEYQTPLAERLGFVASRTSRPSEQLMQEYYRRAKTVMQINSILLQNIGASLFPSPDSSPRTIREHFRKVHEFLDIGDEALFDRSPSAIFEAFLLLQRSPELKGLSATVQRGLWRARRLVDDEFRGNPANRARFLELFRIGRALPQLLRQMNDAGVLGRYLPAFGKVVGQMQHDLFHVYTVDQHILQVIRNLNRFTAEEFAHEYPLCSRLISDLGKPWILYLAALFHDIAKGRGGDHSELGAEDARQFCVDHGLDEEDSALVVWLVRQHLLMSRVAQKQDIGDPEVIARFARAVGDERQLAALYLLTVADIRGTSPKVWNSWKAQLLEQLFDATRRQLLSKETAFLTRGAIARRQREAIRRMRFLALPEAAHEPLWSQLDTVYFLRHSAEAIAWHARVLHDRLASARPVVSVRLNPQAAGLEVLVYTPDQPDLFLRMVGFLSRAGYTIVDARIHTTRAGYALDTFVLLDVGDSGRDREMITYIEHELADRLARGAAVDVPANGRLSRQVRHFPIEPTVSIQPLVSLESDDSGELFVLTVVAADRPGLLFLIARELAGHRANVHTAKIATLGDRVEDTFLISGQVLEDSAGRVRLEADLLRQLHVRVGEAPVQPASQAKPR